MERAGLAVTQECLGRAARRGFAEVGDGRVSGVAFDCGDLGSRHQQQDGRRVAVKGGEGSAVRFDQRLYVVEVGKAGCLVAEDEERAAGADRICEVEEVADLVA